MTSELPIACSLSASDLTERLAQIAELGRDALLGADLAGARAELRFASAPGIRERLAQIGAAESECCAFLTMAVRDEPGALVLAISAPDGGALVLRELVEAFNQTKIR